MDDAAIVSVGENSLRPWHGAWMERLVVAAVVQNYHLHCSHNAHPTFDCFWNFLESLHQELRDQLKMSQLAHNWKLQAFQNGYP